MTTSSRRQTIVLDSANGTPMGDGGVQFTLRDPLRGVRSLQLVAAVIPKTDDSRYCAVALSANGMSIRGAEICAGSGRSTAGASNSGQLKVESHQPIFSVLSMVADGGGNPSVVNLLPQETNRFSDPLLIPFHEKRPYTNATAVFQPPLAMLDKVSFHLYNNPPIPALGTDASAQLPTYRQDVFLVRVKKFYAVSAPS